MPGAPTKLTPTVRDRFAGHIERGETMHAAARLVGLAPQTPANWIRRGKREPETPYGAFAEAVDVARKPWQRTLANEGRFEIEMPPQSAEELNDWFEANCGVRLPSEVLTEGHVSPAEAGVEAVLLRVDRRDRARQPDGWEDAGAGAGAGGEAALLPGLRGDALRGGEGAGGADVFGLPADGAAGCVSRT